MNLDNAICTFSYDLLTLHWWLSLGVDIYAQVFFFFCLKISHFHTNRIVRMHAKSRSRKLVTFSHKISDFLLKTSFIYWQKKKKNIFIQCISMHKSGLDRFMLMFAIATHSQCDLFFLSRSLHEVKRMQIAFAFTYYFYSCFLHQHTPNWKLIYILAN